MIACPIQCCLAVLSVYDRNFYFIGSSQTIANDDLTACGDSVETIHICTVQMLQCILSASRIQCVAVRQERHSALLLTQDLPLLLHNSGEEMPCLPSSPKCILIATNFPSISMSLIPAAIQSFFSLSSWLVPTGHRKSVK